MLGMKVHEVNTNLYLIAPRLRSHSSMLEALAMGDVRRIKLMLKAGSNPNQADAMGRTPLIILTYYSDERKATALAKYIIKVGGKIDYTDSNGMNALHHACQQCKVELVSVFLRYKDDYNVFAKDYNGKMCFEHVHGKQSEGLLKKLKFIAVDYGLDPTVFQIKVPASRSVVKGSGTRILDISTLKHQELKKRPMVKHYGHEMNVAIDKRILYEKNEIHNRSMKTREKTISMQLKETFDKRTINSKKLNLKSNRIRDSFATYVTSLSNERDGKQLYRDVADEMSKQKEPRKDAAGYKQWFKSAKSSKDHLIRILKIYEEQNSTLYREGAKERPNTVNLNNLSAIQSPNNPLEEESHLATKGLASRSMSLLLGSIPTMIRKRRPSRVSLHSNKPTVKSRFADPPNALNITRQRRFSSITFSTISQKPASPEGNASQRVSKIQSVSASGVSSIKKINAERYNKNNDNAQMQNHITQKECTGNFTLVKLPNARSRHVQRKISAGEYIDVEEYK